jgi:hypothetical protein
MAFDMMGNYVGGYMLTPQETEEERLRRLAMENMDTKPTPVKETITTDPVTGQRKIKIEGLERDLSAANVRTPTVSGPISPDMAAIRSVESGNRDFDAQGRPITSPRGAMYSSQVMPATAANPGFGVQPAQSNTAEEYNRVGQDYYNAMLQRYGGDREKALAAYNAGPGRVDRNMATNQGQLNLSQMPAETQGYIPRVMNRIAGALMPSAQAAPAPQGVMTTGPVAPAANMRTPTQEAADDEAIFRATGVRPQAAPGAPTAPVAPTQTPAGTTQMLGLTGTNISTTPAGTVDYDNLLAGSITNKRVRDRMRVDPNVPPMYKAAADSNERTALQQSKDNAEINATVQRMAAGDVRAWESAMKQEGSLLKAIFFGYAGAQDLARNELNKMGYGGKWESGVDENGNRAIIKYRQDGIPMEGYDETGKALTSQQLAAFGAMGGTGKWTTSGTFFQTPNGQILRAQSDEKGRTRLTDTATGAVYRGPTNGLVKLEEAGALRKMDYQLLTDLKRKHGTNVLEAEKDYVALNGPFRNDAERNQFREAYGFGAALPAGGGAAAGGAAGGGAAGGGAAPGQGPGSLQTTDTSALRRPIEEQKADLEARKKAQEIIASEGAKEVAGSAKTQALIAKIDDKIIPTIDSGQHNIGPMLSGVVGRGPIAQSIGSQFETTQSKNTTAIMESIDMLAIEGLRALGANPSQRDLDFYTKNKPQANSNPEFVKEWLQSRSEALKDQLAFNAEQARTGGRAGVAPRPDRNERRGSPGSKSNPIKLD